MPLFEFDGRKILFIHIPKTSGTSIEYFFFKNNSEFKHTNLFTETDFVYNEKRFNSSGQHLKYNEIKTIINVDEYEIFTVVRNPYDRFISEMEYNIQKTGFYTKNNPSKKELLKEFIGWYFGVEELGVVVNNNECNFDHHKNPQYELLEGCDNLTIFYYETINEDFEKKFGGQLENTYQKTERLPYEDYYTKETEEFIYNYYKKDFELFGYNRMKSI